MLFKYTVLTEEGDKKNGSIDTFNKETAIKTLQSRDLTIVSIEAEEEKVGLLARNISFFESVSRKDVVLMSRQMSTLFSAHVPALRIFRMLSVQAENPLLQKVLTKVADDIQGGLSISGALEEHPKVFSPFYVNMVRSGEETGKLSEIFESLAGYLDRSYELSVKIKNALIYPAFVIATFIVVMILMLTLVFPNLAKILIETGQPIPIYTQIIISISDFLINYGVALFVLLVIGGIWLVRYVRTPAGSRALSGVVLHIPVIGTLFRKLYLSRIADNMFTLLTSGISLVRALEITAKIVGNVTYEDIINESMEQVKGGVALSDSFSQHEEIPVVMVQIIKVGEETGDLGGILKTMATFYKREVDNSVDTLIGLIEPMLIVTLGLGVGLILTSVLVPIYNVSTGI